MTSGPDGIPFWLLRDHCDLLAPAVYHICNLSLSTGTVPNCFKKAYVSPVPKCDNPSTADHRPISLLPIISKILERLVLRKWFTDIIQHISPTQFAFVPRIGQGTVTALTYLIHHILSFLDKPGAVRLLLLDYTKAFDKLPHQAIIDALIGFQAPKELVP